MPFVIVRRNKRIFKKTFVSNNNRLPLVKILGSSKGYLWSVFLLEYLSIISNLWNEIAIISRKRIHNIVYIDFSTNILFPYSGLISFIYNCIVTLTWNTFFQHLYELYFKGCYAPQIRSFNLAVKECVDNKHAWWVKEKHQERERVKKQILWSKTFCVERQKKYFYFSSIDLIFEYSKQQILLNFKLIENDYVRIQYLRLRSNWDAEWNNIAHSWIIH